MKKLLLFMILFFGTFQLFSQNLSIHPIEIAVRRPDLNRPYEETFLMISIRNLENDYLQVKDVRFSLEDDLGNDLLNKGRENLKNYEKLGLFTTHRNDWEFIDYKFYKVANAFGGKLLVYAAPDQQAKFILLKANIQVYVKGKGKNTEEVVVNEVNPGRLQKYQVKDGEIRLQENGILTLDNIPYTGYKVTSSIPISTLEVMGQKKLEGIPLAHDEIFVPQSMETFDLKVNLLDAEVINVPIDLKIGLGL